MSVYDGIWQIIFQDQNFLRRSLELVLWPTAWLWCETWVSILLLSTFDYFSHQSIACICRYRHVTPVFPVPFFSLATTMAGSMGGQATYNPALSSNAYNPTSTYSPTGSANSGKKISRSIGLIRATQFHHNTSLTAFRTYKLNTSLWWLLWQNTCTCWS